jgi:hypothetical protein
LEDAAEGLPAAQRKARRSLRSGADQLRTLERDLLKLAGSEPGRLKTPGDRLRNTSTGEVASPSGRANRPTGSGTARNYRVGWKLTGVPGDPFAYARSLLRAAIRLEQPLHTGAEKTGEVELSIEVESADTISALEVGNQAMFELFSAAGRVAPLFLDAHVLPDLERR